MAFVPVASLKHTHNSVILCLSTGRRRPLAQNYAYSPYWHIFCWVYTWYNRYASVWIATGRLWWCLLVQRAQTSLSLRHRLSVTVLLLKNLSIQHTLNAVMLIPASIMHIGNRHKIGHCFMMSCNSNVVPMQYLLNLWVYNIHIQ